MADIDVVPKKRTSMWLWIVVAIVVAVILFALLGGFASDDGTRVGEVSDSPSLAVAFVV